MHIFDPDLSIKDNYLKADDIDFAAWEIAGHEHREEFRDSGKSTARSAWLRAERMHVLKDVLAKGELVAIGIAKDDASLEFRRIPENLFLSAAKGRRKKATAIKPIAPFETDHQKAVALAFDRETGLPVLASSLRTYADALMQYHISPESKFLNAEHLDRGTTQRRHVRMANVLHIGKEAHDWERQAMLGLDAGSEIAYGISNGELAEMLRDIVAKFGERPAAKALGISIVRLTALVSGSPCHVAPKLAASVAARLPSAIVRAEKLCEERDHELQRLRELVQLHGLRGAARLLGIDPSNLRRKLKSPI